MSRMLLLSKAACLAPDEVFRLRLAPNTLSMLKLDTFAFTGINENCPGWLATFLAVFTRLGSFSAILIALGMVAGVLIWRRQWKYVIPCVVAVVLAEELGQGVKAWVQRTRPWHVVPGAHVVGYGASGFSFPSGHSTASFAFAVAVGFLWPSWRIPLLVFAVLVALSRVVVGAHYPGDVLGGAALGTFCSVAVWMIWSRFFGRPTRALPVAGP